MITKIELESMKFYAFHGVSPQEMRVGNNFVVGITLEAPLEKAVASDELENTINYADIYNIVKQEMEIPSRLLEHAAGRILYALKAAFPELKEVEVKLSKMNPPFGGDVLSASVILKESYL